MDGLTEAQIRAVQREAADVLARVGFEVQDEALLGVARQAGARVDATSGRVRLDPELLAELLGRAPRTYEIAGGHGRRFTIGGGEAGCLAIVTDPWILDADGGRRHPALADVRRHTRIAQCLDEVVAISLMDYPVTDVPGPASNLRAMEAHLLDHDKHLQVMPASLPSLELWLRAARILLGGDEVAGSRRLSVGVAVRSPLVLTPLNAQLLRTACAHDLPVVPTVCPMAGSTAPFSRMGALLLGHAEILFLAALTQMLRPGHPYLYAFGPSRADLRSGEDLYYTLDKVLWKAAGVQLAAALGLPTAAECGGTMAARHDLQSGAEGVLFMRAAVTAGADLLAGIGSCGNAVTMSGEMMLVQRAWLRAARFLARGFDAGDLPDASAAIERVGPGAHFMADASTLARLRTGEFFEDELFDMEGEPGGEGRSMLDRAQVAADALVADFASPHDGETQERLRRFFDAECAAV